MNTIYSDTGAVKRTLLSGLGVLALAALVGCGARMDISPFVDGQDSGIQDSSQQNDTGGTPPIACNVGTCGPAPSIAPCPPGSRVVGELMCGRFTAEEACKWIIPQCVTDPPAKCVVSGCSGEICDSEKRDSACVYKPEYACYNKLGICERDASGKCGWKKTPELVACLNPPPPPSDAGLPTTCLANKDCSSGEVCATSCMTNGPGLCIGSSSCSKSDPSVCGCDGKTYANKCEAAKAGQGVGVCPQKFCGGIGGIPCPSGYTCVPSDGMCMVADGGGTCKQLPSVCTKELNYVCGCDGKTYDNRCFAEKAGAAINYAGKCSTSTSCSSNAGCLSKEYCALSAGCGVMGGGICTPRPDVCSTEYKPVCGCDGKTYPNECAARAYGVTVASTGACSPSKICGGFIGAQCSTGEYCKYETASKCGFADQQGVCTKKPEVCSTEWNPVCGCDGKSYGNACTASLAGTSVQYLGKCL